jgi:hypothetical protein
MRRLRAQGRAVRTISEHIRAKGVAISHMGMKNGLRRASLPRSIACYGLRRSVWSAPFMVCSTIHISAWGLVRNGGE